MGRPKKTNKSVGEYNYYRIRKKIGGSPRDFYGKTKSEAEAKYKKALGEWKETQLLGDKITFGAWADEWIKVSFWESALAERTKATYVSAWEKNVRPADIYGKKISDVTSLDIQALYNSMDCPPSTIKKCHNLMRRFYDYLAREGVCLDVSRNAHPPKAKPDEEKPSIVVWTDDEWKTILTSFDKAQPGFRYKALIQLAFATGARVSELLALRQSDVYQEPDTQQYFVKIRRQIVPVKRDGSEKTELTVGPLKSARAKRDIPLFGLVAFDVLVEHQIQITAADAKRNGWTNPRGYLFLTETGHFIDKGNLRRALDRYYSRIGVPCKGIHTYRRTFGTLCYRSGVDIEVCARLMGHASTATTSKYYIDISPRDTIKALGTLMNPLKNNRLI